MTRWKITIEYKGKNYAGWQSQPEQKTVQGEIEKAINDLFKSNITIQGAGRTDSGVNATGQVAHFDMETDFDEFKMCKALNHYLWEEDIAILNAEKVADDWNARFDAKQRQYIYRISNRRAPLTFNRDNVWYTGGYELDLDKMTEAGKLLVGTHDFTTFRASHATHQKPIRTVDYLDVVEVGNEIHIRCGAKSFLHNQVRYFTGALFRVGYGKWTKDDVQRCLDVKDRNQGGPLAPPNGLYLTKVVY
ncbi:MAG: tRNA pseudouridine(38-40) synthase TruA [Alphaproteobacteria bacterium]